MSCLSLVISDVLLEKRSHPALLPKITRKRIQRKIFQHHTTHQQKQPTTTKAYKNKLQPTKSRIIKSHRSQSKHLFSTDSILRIKALEKENVYLRTQIQAIQDQLQCLHRDQPLLLNSMSTMPTSSSLNQSQSKSTIASPPTVLSYSQAMQSLKLQVSTPSPQCSTAALNVTSTLQRETVSRHQISPPDYRETILALPVKDRLEALLQQPSVPPQPPTPVTSLIVRLPLSLSAQTSKTFSIRTAIHAITNVNILDANIIEKNLFEIFIPLAVYDQVQSLLQTAGVL